MQKVMSKRSVSKFAIIANLSSNLRDTSQKHTVNTSFIMYNTIQNNEVSPVKRHLETLWRHFADCFCFAKCLQSLSLNQTVVRIWRHFAALMLPTHLGSQSITFEVSLSVSAQLNLSLGNVSEMSLNSGSFYQ